MGGSLAHRIARGYAGAKISVAFPKSAHDEVGSSMEIMMSDEGDRAIDRDATDARVYDPYQIVVGRPHVVLLGAGASLACFPKGEKHGRRLPLMSDFVETVKGLAQYLDERGIAYRDRNFEDLYSALCDTDEQDRVRTRVEELIYGYFADMELPDEPTLYDHLVLALTGRDAIATFNWDPFLWQAMCRNYKRVGAKNLPRPIYLHGNTAVGACISREKVQISHKGGRCRKCGERLRDSRLLYPVGKKDYNADPLIKSGWTDLRQLLQDAFMFTIFGYSAPSSDVEAAALLKEGWGDREQRAMEEIEIIDVLPEDLLRGRWDNFILSHHYSAHSSFYSSLIAQCPRRSCDACFNAVVNCIPWEERPIPKGESWAQLDEWLSPFLEAENERDINH
jgi:hypothetical protein